VSICRKIFSKIDDHLEEILALRDTRRLKADGSFVTEGDLLCESLVMEFVAGLPVDFVVISEESPLPEVDLQRGNVLVVDPIDGTENFTSGLSEWGVGISIFHEGAHQESGIALPEMGRSLVTGDRIRKFESRIQGLSSSLKKKDLVTVFERFEYRVMGCCMYNMYNVIRGSYRVFENFKGANSWDILPGLNLALEHGLYVEVNGEQYHGELLRPDKKICFRVSHKQDCDPGERPVDRSG